MEKSLLNSKCNDHSKIVLPDGLKELMSDISREVLRSQPPDDEFYEFIASYLSALIMARDAIYFATTVCEDVYKTCDSGNGGKICGMPDNVENDNLHNENSTSVINLAEPILQLSKHKPRNANTVDDNNDYNDSHHMLEENHLQVLQKSSIHSIQKKDAVEKKNAPFKDTEQKEKSKRFRINLDDDSNNSSDCGIVHYSGSYINNLRHDVTEEINAEEKENGNEEGSDEEDIWKSDEEEIFDEDIFEEQIWSENEGVDEVIDLD